MDDTLLKTDQSAGEALAQIRQKGYSDKFRLENKPAIGARVRAYFDTAQRAVTNWSAGMV